MMNALKALKECYTVCKSWIRDKDVATLIPTLPPAIAGICEKMDLSARRVVMEYGPGTGVITRRLLKKAESKESSFILIEKNPDLASHLHEHITDPRVRIFCESAEQAPEILRKCGETHADYILSGIPFSRLPADVAREIVQRTFEILKDDGAFVVYQFLWSARKYLEELFPRIEADFEFWNIPPLFIYEARKCLFSCMTNARSQG